MNALLAISLISIKYFEFAQLWMICVQILLIRNISHKLEMARWFKGAEVFQLMDPTVFARCHTRISWHCSGNRWLLNCCQKSH